MFLFWSTQATSFSIALLENTGIGWFKMFVFFRMGDSGSHNYFSAFFTISIWDSMLQTAIQWLDFVISCGKLKCCVCKVVMGMGVTKVTKFRFLTPLVFFKSQYPHRSQTRSFFVLERDWSCRFYWRGSVLLGTLGTDITENSGNSTTLACFSIGVWVFFSFNLIYN